MLQDAGVPFETMPARIDEAAVKSSMLNDGAPPRDIADTLAGLKAEKIARKCPGRLVLGSDQVLSFEGDILDKPDTVDEAREHLRRLRGKTHQLISAVVFKRDHDTTFKHIEVARLTMRDFSDDFLEDYLGKEGEAILACVGAYRLEGHGAQLFSRIIGDYFTILGLPFLPSLEHLRHQGIIQT